MFSNHEPTKLKRLKSDLSKLKSELATLTSTEQQLNNWYRSETSDMPVIFPSIGGFALFVALLDYERVFLPYDLGVAVLSIPLTFLEHLTYKFMNSNPNLSANSEERLVKIINDFKLDVKIAYDKKSILTVAQKFKDKIEVCSLKVEECSKTLAEEERQYQAFADDSFNRYQNNNKAADAKDEPIPVKRF